MEEWFERSETFFLFFYHERVLLSCPLYVLSLRLLLINQKYNAAIKDQDNREKKKKEWDTIINSTFELNLPFLSFLNADHLI